MVRRRSARPATDGNYALIPAEERQFDLEEQDERRQDDELDEADQAEVLRLEDSLGRLKIRGDEVKNRLGQVMSRLDEALKFWNERKDRLEKEVADIDSEASAQEDLLHRIRHPELYEEEPVPPGPQCLNFLQGQAFLLVSSAIIITNIVTMFMEMLHPRYKHEFFFLDQFFLTFYVLELLFKAMLFQRELLCGPCQDAWWNWLDLVIVSTGVLDQWLKPILLASGLLPESLMQSTWALAMVRMLRLARLPRILKVVRLFFKSDLSWAAGDRFQLFMMSVIGFNCILMSFEADSPHFFLWSYIENMLMIIFMFELCVRIKLGGCGFFYEGYELMWNWLDFIIVMGGVVETWLMPCIDVVQALMGLPPTQKSHIGQVLIMLRMARLLRILRLVRLIKNIPPLFTLLVGIVQAMYGMIWVLVLTTVLLYTAALLCVKLIGQGLVGHVPEDVASVFPNVPQSMFVLFMAMNGNAELLTPLFEAFPVTKLVFVIYMVVLSWGILSILTAVVSENMINATEAHREEVELIEQERLCQNSKDWLSEIFDKTDLDGTGMVERQEFEDMMKDDHLVDELCSAAGGLRKVDLVALFDCLSSVSDDSFFIRRKDFVEGLMTHAQAPSVSQRDILRLEKRLLMQERVLLQMMDRLDEVAVASSAATDAATIAIQNMGKSERLSKINSRASGSSVTGPRSSHMKFGQHAGNLSMTQAKVKMEACKGVQSSGALPGFALLKKSATTLLQSAAASDYDNLPSWHTKDTVTDGKATPENEAGLAGGTGSADDLSGLEPQAAPAPGILSGTNSVAALAQQHIQQDGGSNLAASRQVSHEFMDQTSDSPGELNMDNFPMSSHLQDKLHPDFKWAANQIQSLNVKFLSFQENQDEAIMMMRRLQGYLLLKQTEEAAVAKSHEVRRSKCGGLVPGSARGRARNVSVRCRPPIPVAPPMPQPF